MEDAARANLYKPGSGHRWVPGCVRHGLARPWFDGGKMKHATPSSLSKLGALLGQLREIDGLKEKTLGVFYLKSKAFLHFHDDPAGIFADVRRGPDWDRYPVNTGGEKQRLLRAVRTALEQS